MEVFDPAGATLKAVNGRVPISVSMRYRSRTAKVLLAGEDKRVVILDPDGAKVSVAPGQMHDARTVYSVNLLDGQVPFAPHYETLNRIEGFPGSTAGNRRFGGDCAALPHRGSWFWPLGPSTVGSRSR